MANRIFEQGNIPADANGKRWYIVNSWFDLYSKTGKVECNLAPALSLTGVPIRYENERKAVVKVKNLLNGWGHAENRDTVCNALELLWEEKKITGAMYRSLWMLTYKAA